MSIYHLAEPRPDDCRRVQHRNPENGKLLVLCPKAQLIVDALRHGNATGSQMVEQIRTIYGDDDADELLLQVNQFDKI